jgi:hypothetical protein
MSTRRLAIVKRGVVVEVVDDADDDCRSRVCHLSRQRVVRPNEFVLLEADTFLRLEALGVVVAEV